MDPVVCLYEILHSLSSVSHKPEDREELAYHLHALGNWVDKGGFLPKVAIVADGEGNAFKILEVQ